MNYPFSEYKKQSEPEQYQKAANWGIAIGLQQVDGLTPSKYLIAIAKDNIEGKLSIDEASKQVSRYYQKNPVKTVKEQNEKEADEVSVRITKLLSTHTFSFSPAELFSIHKFLFTGILDSKEAGKIRTYDITKKEPILNGDTVIYGRSDSIMATLDYDFQTEKKFHYKGLSQQKKVEHLAQFISGIWQIHPFVEGNTRTTAVFTIKYLYTLGFETNNDLFEKYSNYFRNALVRANYQDLSKNIPYTTEYLNKFFHNLLLGGNFQLDSTEMQIKDNSTTAQKNTQKTTQKTAPTTTQKNTPTTTQKMTPATTQKTTQENTRKILKYLKQNPSATRQELATRIGMTPDGIKWNLDKLKKLGKIVRIGPDKGGHWEVK